MTEQIIAMRAQLRESVQQAQEAEKVIAQRDYAERIAQLTRRINMLNYTYGNGRGLLI